MTQLVENGRLIIPLYHGTSTLFVDSIKEYGLGAVNPIKSYSASSFLKQAFDVCEEIFAGEQEWESCKFATNWIAEQKSFADHSNFQHGDTYFSPSRASAVGYALTSRFGSELITQAYRLYS